MKTAAIIAEFNPFHEGHRYIIQQAKEQTEADLVLILMSGDWVQRGEPAIFDKYDRAKVAIEAGADLVLELPTPYATASAEEFAYGAVKILNELKQVDYLVFGSEGGNIEALKQAAQVLVEEPESFKKTLKVLLKEGNSFPKARQEALKAYVQEKNRKHEDLDMVLSTPNNILGIEYLKALIRLDSTIEPICIKRDLSLRSAHSIRKKIQETSSSEDAVFADDFSEMLSYRLLLETKADLIRYSDMSEELANRLLRSARDNLSWSERIAQIKTKQYTYKRISRCLLHVLLSITREEVEAWKNSRTGFVRLLGMNEAAFPFLKRYTRNEEELKILMRLAEAEKVLDEQNYEKFCNTLKWNSIYQIKAQRGMTEFERRLFIKKKMEVVQK